VGLLLFCAWERERNNQGPRRYGDLEDFRTLHPAGVGFASDFFISKSVASKEAQAPSH